MRVKLAVVGAVLTAVFLAGSAWADVNSVKQAITNYGLTASDSGNTITVTGNVSKPASEVLDLGDITGLVIDWKADLTVTGGSRPYKGWGMINFSNGSFNLTDGTIQLPSSANTWVDGIYAKGNAIVTVNGGKVKGARAKDTGINVEYGTLIINSGEMNIPCGNMLFAKNLTVNNPSVLNGLACVGDVTDYTVTVYGHATTVPDSEVFYNKYDEGDELPDSISYVVPSGATWDIEEVTSDMTGLPTVAIVSMRVKNGGKINFKNTNLTFKGAFDVEDGGELNIGIAHGDTSRLTNVGGTASNHGTINIYGTLTNEDKLINGPTGIIHNHSNNTLDNKGTLTNNGTINNKDTGKITNTGRIDNTNGTITNEGTFQSVQTASQMGGTVNGDVQPLSNNTSSGGGGGGGCDAGFGMVGLLLAGLAALKQRRV
jgi:MYXO-CTERM domain-containing protein